jgi:Na+-translocating ferredoxin:NAD+ oxidoreductase RnfC subunit
MFQAELAVAGRVLDYDRFIRNGGLKCIRCGNCQSFCVQYLPLPQMFGTMQEETRAAITRGIVPRTTLHKAMAGGLVGKEFIDDVVKALA